jgi:dihydroorotase
VEKAAPFAEAPSGMIGLETAFSLGIRELVNKGYLPLMQFVAMMTCNPAAFYQLPAGRIETGGTADLMIADLHASWKVTDRFASRSSDSPFIGEVLPGVVRYTIASGKVVYHS